jgi:hypothetical protein
LFFTLIGKNTFVMLNCMRNIRIIGSATILHNITELAELQFAR